ncbi:ribosome recycling factor [Apilactobacillus xinyiensis]|uniref:ribosome recycling factor n=1 Tax=Apilactobacillus xinyiensis TaxID=2841032 RepID=UPI001C7E1AC9|nr:ribosome recycling factor [Apilactobacillus xinyiensis]MCL0311612.1 ribosome recycling factor [Apilactobacillus xinyiensis]MCL0318243.1 ribosome recycling factor [Apilactobacillus xinyiensis]MCL0330011.1 ribosome recycling factor [Apilactobacillus xinyiensis]
MNSNEIISSSKDRMSKAEQALKRELSTIRAGHANASLLNNVKVSYYGADTPLNQIASITIPEPRVIMVTPYDKSALDNIEKGILEANIGINPANDGDNIRLVVPQLTEERRKEIAKQVKATGEQSKVAVRNVRRDSMDSVKKGNKNDDFTDDEAHRLEDEIQKITDASIKNVEQIVADKEKEVMNG